MKNELFINWCDKGMVFSFYALIYFLPISIALTEIFTGLTLLFYLLKRGSYFVLDLSEIWKQGKSLNFNKGVRLFLKSFKPINSCLNWPIAIYIAINGLSIVFSRYQIQGIEGFFGKILQEMLGHERDIQFSLHEGRDF